FARHEEEKLRMDALVGATDGRRMIRVHGVIDAPADDASTDDAPVGDETTGDASVVLARRLVDEALAAGAAELLAAEA
ncbi:MAG: hypothetical protein KDD78_01405, partial [Caldilineaceae bacterium]|nr:hypothetical protein [Caldilineaceae bacterium]